MFQRPFDGTAGSQGPNWLSHMLGITKLVKIRGPYQCATGRSHRLFIDTRLNGVGDDRQTKLDVTAILIQARSLLP